MSMTKAAVNYYARLIRKNVYTIEKVPEDIREEVLAKVKELGPREIDPVTETPEEK